MRKAMVPLSSVALAAVIALSAGAAGAEEERAQRVEVGQEAPDFTLPDLDGDDHTLSDHRGEKDLLLVFFRGAW